MFHFRSLTGYSKWRLLIASFPLLKLYVHCSVFLSDQGVTFGSKSCSYNAIEARCVHELKLTPNGLISFMYVFLFGFFSSDGRS